MRLLFFGCSVLLSVFLGFWAAFYALYLDWSLLEIGVICIMPALVILDLFCMAAQVWAARRKGVKKEEAGNETAGLASLAALHLLTAAMAVVLLACPTAGVWTAGPGMLRVRAIFVSLACLGFLLSLRQPLGIARLAGRAVSDTDSRTQDERPRDDA